MPGINAFKDQAVLKFFLYFSLSGAFPTMIFYITVPMQEPGNLGKAVHLQSSLLSLKCIFISHIDFYTEY